MTISHIPEILALIPARGGSKGIPRKNVMMIAGKPLISFSIEQSLASRYISRTIVSTDDLEIAEVSRRFGAEVPFLRPSELAQDLSPDIDVFRHALTWLEDNEGYACELVVHLRPTGPVRRVEMIDEAIEAMLKIFRGRQFSLQPQPDAVRGCQAQRITEAVEQLMLLGMCTNFRLLKHRQQDGSDPHTRSLYD